MTKYLGIDYGTKHVGVAVAEAMLATPLVTLSNNATLLDKLGELCEHEQIEIIVCGMPEGKLESEIAAFAKKLEVKVERKVILHPETLSTQEAILQLRASGAKRSKLKNDHVYAAVLILEDYLEQNKIV